MEEDALVLKRMRDKGKARSANYIQRQLEKGMVRITALVSEATQERIALLKELAPEKITTGDIIEEALGIKKGKC